MRNKTILLPALLALAITAYGQTSSPTGTINGHDYVDLGLSVKWATCNVGASSPSDYGDYFAWGETQPKASYTKKNSATNKKKGFGDIAGDPLFDAARVNWGGTWRLATADEWEELVDNCKWEAVSLEEHNGYLVTGPNGNSIFLPAAGARIGTKHAYPEANGYYSSATPHKSDAKCAYELYFDIKEFYGYWEYRDLGLSVRPVSN